MDKHNFKSFRNIYYAGIKAGNYREIIKIFEECLEFKPGSLEIMRYLSSLYLNVGKHRMAKDTAERGLTLDHKDSWLSSISYESGRMMDADLKFDNTVQP
jgi:tetratricopeptide (TPR) repeat protein